MVSYKGLLRILVFMTGFLITSCGTNSTESKGNRSKENESEKNGIVLEDLHGNAVNLNDYQGNVVILNFWATWCKPCISEMPSIDRLCKKLEGEDFTFIAASDENLDKIKKYAERNPYNFRYAHLKTNMYELGLSALPTTYIFGRDGQIIEKITGAREWDSSETVEKLKSI